VEGCRSSRRMLGLYEDASLVVGMQARLRVKYGVNAKQSKPMTRIVLKRTLLEESSRGLLQKSPL